MRIRRGNANNEDGSGIIGEIDPADRRKDRGEQEQEGRASKMYDQAVPRTSAWRWGLLFGVINAAPLNGVGLLLGYLIPGTSQLVSNVIDIALFGISLLLCGYAGYIAARKSGNPSTGNSAGLYAGLVTAIISVPLSLLLLYNGSQIVRQFIGLYIFSFACTFVIYIVLALVAGVIGGKLAQRKAVQG